MNTIKHFIKWSIGTIETYWRHEFIRFLVVGGVNTLIGGISIPFIFTLLLEQDFLPIFGFLINLPVLYGYLLWFAFAYMLQVFIVFKTRIDWRSFIIYPFTQFPNLGLNLVFIHIFRNILVWKIDFINVALSAILPIPIMFFLVRYVIKGTWMQRKEKPHSSD